MTEETLLPSVSSDSRRHEMIRAVLALAVLGVMCAFALVFALRHGSYLPSDWLVFLMPVTLCAAVIAAFGPPLRLGRLQTVLLLLFGLQVVWTAASFIWAGSRSNAWEEINRTFLYFCAFATGAAAVRWYGSRARFWLGLGLVSVVTVVALMILIRVGFAADQARYFPEGRLSYPVTYTNGIAALLMVGLWLALGMANSVRSRARQVWLQPVLLALGAIFLELAVLSQSRGALWTTILMVPLFLILSPGRFRALTNLALVGIPLVVFWSPLNGVYVAVRDQHDIAGPISRAWLRIGISVIVVLVLWLITWVVQRLIQPHGNPLPRRLATWIGVILLASSCVAAGAGLLVANQRTGGLDSYVSRAWAGLYSDESTVHSSSTRLMDFGLSGRLEIWEISGQAFESHPLLGLGAQNFEPFYYAHRVTLRTVKQPHSQPLQLLAELGLPGLLLYATFVLGVLVRAIVLRFRGQGREDQAVLAAMIVASTYWLVHSSVDWLWQLAGVTLPVVLMLGALLGTGPSHQRPASQPTLAKRWLVRGPLVLAALVVFASAFFPFLSMTYLNAATRNTMALPGSAIAATRTAARFDPFSPEPASTRADILAQQIAVPDTPAAATGLALVADARQQAASQDAGDWLLAYKAGEALLDYRDALATTVGPTPVGTGSPSLDSNPLTLSRTQLGTLAEMYLERAKRLNPLEYEIQAALDRL